MNILIGACVCALSIIVCWGADVDAEEAGAEQAHVDIIKLVATLVYITGLALILC